MPSVLHPDRLAATYKAAKQLIESGRIPTDIILSDRRLFRIINPKSPYSTLTKPATGGFVSKEEGFKLMIPSDGRDSTPALASINQNRFSGISGFAYIPPAGGFYTSLQQQALLNEKIHYAKFDSKETSALALQKMGKYVADDNGPLKDQCILQFRVLGSLHVADLSPHNPGAMAFFGAIGANTWKEVNDPLDCSVARGIGLAVANSRHLTGMIVRTVRSSDQAGKRGDNLLLFSRPGSQIQHIALEKAMYFDDLGGVEVFPAAFG